MMNGKNEFDFTANAWRSLYSAVDNEEFQDQDAEVIYMSLQSKLKLISFGDYLRRYIYLKAGLTEPFNEVPVREYQLIIKSAFEDNHTPASFTPTTAKLSALSKNWLTQQTVKRNVVFLLGFGLNMSVEDVNVFLTKALREPEINPKDPFEVICWYCYKNKYSYLKFRQLWELYETHRLIPLICRLSTVNVPSVCATVCFRCIMMRLLFPMCRSLKMPTIFPL